MLLRPYERSLSHRTPQLAVRHSAAGVASGGCLADVCCRARGGCSNTLMCRFAGHSFRSTLIRHQVGGRDARRQSRSCARCSMRTTIHLSCRSDSSGSGKPPSPRHRRQRQRRQRHGGHRGRGVRGSGPARSRRPPHRPGSRAESRKISLTVGYHDFQWTRRPTVTAARGPASEAQAESVPRALR